MTRSTFKSTGSGDPKGTPGERLMYVLVFWMQVMKVMCKQGYKDALHFLKKNGEKLWLPFVKAAPLNKPVGRRQIYL